MICDAHCHLDLMNNMPDFINEVQNSDMSLFAVGTTPRAYNREVQFCKNTQNIYVGLGMHPQLVSSGYDDMQVFKEVFEQNHYIGEVGLDFSKGYIRTKESQIKIFSEIIRLCEQHGEKVISIHSLKSTSAVIEILKTYKMQNNNRYINNHNSHNSKYTNNKDNNIILNNIINNINNNNIHNNNNQTE